MTDLDALYVKWTQATDKLQPGVKRVFKEVLASVEDGSMTTLVYGADYSGKGACLVNASGALLAVGGGQGVPSANFGEVVSLFDQINGELFQRGVNTNNYVSPLAADILLHHYAPVDDQEVLTAGQQIKKLRDPDTEVYIEPSDDEIREALLNAFNGPAPQDVVTPFDDVTVDDIATVTTEEFSKAMGLDNE